MLSEPRRRSWAVVVLSKMADMNKSDGSVTISDVEGVSLNPNASLSESAVGTPPLSPDRLVSGAGSDASGRNVETYREELDA